MRNCKCADCAEYINQWCKKVKDSPYPDLIRDCEYFHDIETNVEKIIRCRDCKFRYTDGENVTANYCLLNHNRVQADDWFCADAEMEEE